MVDVPNFLRKPYGPGWALVGDAGCHKDPFSAHGICYAFRDAELSGHYPTMQALADYERRRNEAIMTDYKQNLDRAQFIPLPTDISRLPLALAGNQEDTNRYYLAIQGMIPPETFFNWENVQRIVALARGGG